MYELKFINFYDKKVMLSNDPIIVSAMVTPLFFTNMYVEVTIALQEDPSSPVYKPIKQQKMVLDSAGIVKFDVSSIVAPYLEFFVPETDLDNTVLCDKTIRNFSVTIDLYNSATGNTKEATAVDIVRVLKGGTSYEHFLPPSGNFKYNSDEHYLFTPSPDPNGNDYTEKVFGDDNFFMHLLIPSNVAAARTYKLDYGVNYLDIDGTQKKAEGKLHNDIVADAEAKVICMPGGFLQNGLDTKIPTGATAISYWIDVYYLVASVKRRGNFKLVTYFLEQRNFYNTRRLLYRTSLGSLMPVTIKGTIEQEAAYDNQTFSVTDKAVANSKNVAPTIAQTTSVEEYKFKAETGLITKFEAERLRDFFTSNEHYELLNGRFMPIVITNKSVKFYSNQDTLYSIPIEWQYGFTNRHFTIGSTAAASCPAMLNFFWQQSLGNSIRVNYSLPLGYNYFRVTVQFPAPADAQYFYIQAYGNTGAATINVAWPAGITTPVDVELSANVMCSRYNKVPSYGPTFTTPAQSLQQSLAVVAGTDVFTVPPGNSTPIVLSPSVLANDTDPQGGELEVIPVVNQPTTNGGTISINEAGIVTYTPPVSTFIGTDSFVYQVQVVGSGSPVNGNIVFNISATSVAVYATSRLGDFQNVGFTQVAYGIYINLYNSSAGLVSVIGNNLTVNYQKTVKRFSAYDNFTTPLSTVNTTATAIINDVSSVKVFTGPTEEWQPDSSGFLTIKQITTIQVLAGTGYQAL